jgi:flagellar protein FlgJ
VSATFPGVALDTKPLDQLRAAARTDPDKALAAAAKQFEMIFMQMLLKSMRDSVPSGGLFDSQAGKTYTEMLDGQLAQNLSGKGLGIAEMLVKQLKPLAAASSVAAPDAPGSKAPAAARPLSALDPLSSPLAALAPSLEADAPAGVVLPPGVDQAASASAAGPVAPGVRAAQAFVDQMLPGALAVQQETGVPAEFMLGQAALESGWGRRQPVTADGRPSHNLFGIKADASWKGASVEAATTEYVDGQPRQVVQRFRAYGSYAEAFHDYARMLTSSPRYAQAVQGARSAAAFAVGLQGRGYATDPAYAEKLTKVINQTIALAAPN